MIIYLTELYVLFLGIKKQYGDYLSFILIPRKWWSVKAWRLAATVRSKMLMHLNLLYEFLNNKWVIKDTINPEYIKCKPGKVIP